MIIAMAVSLTAGTVLSAIMPTFELTVLARFLSGLPHGAFLGTASLLAGTLMGPGSQGKGVAVALSGIAVSNLLGVPVLTALGQATSWRTVYLLLAGVFLIAAIALYLTMPQSPRRRGGASVMSLPHCDASKSGLSSPAQRSVSVDSLPSSATSPILQLK